MQAIGNRAEPQPPRTKPHLIDRYLLGEWLKILGLLLAATMGLLVMQALYDNFRDLIQLEGTKIDAAQTNIDTFQKETEERIKLLEKARADSAGRVKLASTP